MVLCQGGFKKRKIPIWIGLQGQRVHRFPFRNEIVCKIIIINIVEIYALKMKLFKLTYFDPSFVEK